jgi:SWI/SNF-related matrix-associated actin-dependent regulator 1 of chromatin subfamily A
VDSYHTSHTAGGDHNTPVKAARGGGSGASAAAAAASSAAASSAAAAATSRVVEQGDVTALASDVTLKPYQLVGINWLWLLHQQRVNGVLADEVGR